MQALPRRPRQSHKGDFGRVLIVGGGVGMPGAARLCGEACLRAGAGLVTVATAPENLVAIVAGRPELICLPLAALSLAQGHASVPGGVLALISGVVTSGLGYAIWYRVVPRLKPVVAASVQLTVPLIAALGGVLVLQETLSARLVLAGVFILGGVGLTIVSHRR